MINKNILHYKRMGIRKLKNSKTFDKKEDFTSEDGENISFIKTTGIDKLLHNAIPSVKIEDIQDVEDHITNFFKNLSEFNIIKSLGTNLNLTEETGDVSGVLMEKLGFASESTITKLAWYMNNIYVPILCFAITLLYGVLIAIPHTNADELFNRFSGQYEELLCIKLKKIIKDETEVEIKNTRQNAKDAIPANTYPGHPEYDNAIIERDAAIQLLREARDISIKESCSVDASGIYNIMNTEGKLDNVTLTSEGLTKKEKIYMKYNRYQTKKQRWQDDPDDDSKPIKNITNLIDKIYNYLFYIPRHLIDIDNDTNLMCKRIIYRMTETNGIMKNIVIEFLDWYNEGALFHSVIAIATVGMSVQIVTSVGLTLFLRLSDIISKSLNLSDDTVWFLSILGMLLYCITWVALFHIAPVVSFLSLFSFFNIIFMIPFIIFFHFEDLLCVVDRGGYKQNPLLLPFASSICSLSKTLTGDNRKCTTDKEILEKTCKVFKIVPKLVWAITCFPVLLLIQIVLLYMAILLKVMSIMNPITLVYWLAGKYEVINEDTGEKEDTGGVTVPIEIPGIGAINLPDINYELKLKWGLPLTVIKPFWEPIAFLLAPESWSESLVEIADNITWLDKMTWQVNKLVVKGPSDLVGEALVAGGGGLIKMATPEELGWLENGDVIPFP